MNKIKKIMKYFLLAVAASLISNCSSGGETNPAPNPDAQPEDLSANFVHSEPRPKGCLP